MSSSLGLRSARPNRSSKSDAPTPDEHGQVVGGRLLAEDSRVDGRIGRIAGFGRLARHQPADLVGEVLQRRLQSCAVPHVQVERRDQTLFGDRQRGDAGLVRTLEWDECGLRDRRRGRLGRRTAGQRRARAYRDTGAQRPGDEAAARDPSSLRRVGQLSFSAPAICDRFSESPASWAFSASATCGVTVTAGQRGDGNSLFSGQKLTQPSP